MDHLSTSNLLPVDIRAAFDKGKDPELNDNKSHIPHRWLSLAYGDLNKSKSDYSGRRYSGLIQTDDAKVIIIGAGPAGYSAAIYAARAGLNPIVYEGDAPGGQLMSTTDVENYPGFPDGVQGPQLMEEMRKQSERFGTTLIQEKVNEVDLSQYPFVVKTDSHIKKAFSIIIATGATAKRLDIPGTRDGEFWQKGVSACAICDGALPLFRNKHVYVIGGGDSALEEAAFLTKFAQQVFVVNRSDKLKASHIMQQRAFANPKITILQHSVIEEVKGEGVVGSVVIKNVKTNETTAYKAAGVFFAVGHNPNTSFLNGQLKLTNGYIQVDNGVRTSVPNVYAAGDVKDFIFRQAITAAASGVEAALTAEKDLLKKL